MTELPRTAFVTGGSGFVGRALIRRLVSDGWKVRALARSDGAAGVVEELGAEAVRGDLAGVEEMTAGAAGAELAFHLAADVRAWGERAEFERVNVVGTANVLGACARAGVERVVHCSTEAVLLAGGPLVGADETAPRRPDSPALYSATKAVAEELVEGRNGDGLETVIVRPRFVWGAGDTTLLPALVGAARSGRLRWLDGGTHRTSTTQVDNTVEGLILAGERGRPGEIYFVLDDGSVVFRDFISELLGTQGVEAPGGTIPGWLARGMAVASESAWATLGLSGEPPITRFATWVAGRECTLDDSKARRELGYAPVTTRAEGMDELRELAAPAAAT